ncbi:Uncharacterized protein, contains GBA2_N and DUF608 domains [Olivibacter domesticus]|uniref:Uncharacterized protein, contains GBA2_N and DUF608 domains n=2 Tax=Olivibacter domesticus TaxID=407022 RepID=A0A1H7JJW0_OLID1|nr:Uncharacterized protein, contains GBA2_N and DUF608 domains [Olivibacter domesticus]
MQRRRFLKQSVLIGFGLLATRFPTWAASTFAQDYPKHNIPVDKNIDANWLRGLRVRGTPISYLKSRNELNYIGMPVGGLHSGTVYIGGDGRLWLWQIYNQTIEPCHEGIDPKTVRWDDGTSVREIRSRDGSAYVEPAIAENKRVLDQGFAIKVIYKGETFIKELKADHWEEVIFQPSYPISLITYKTSEFPVEVQFTAYAPFIPLDTESSSLPATILRLEIKNLVNEDLEMSIVGWMENGANRFTAEKGKGKKRSKVNDLERGKALLFDFSSTDKALASAQDAGTMCLACHTQDAYCIADFSPWPVSSESFNKLEQGAAQIEKDAGEKLVGAILLGSAIEAGKSFKADYSISWHFNNLHPKLKELVKDAQAGYWYATKFKDAWEVNQYIASKWDYLTTHTELWQQTWNDSSLPHWFLDRTFVNIGTLATANTYRFASGRFWGWEGVGACPGTCTHVWQYAQAVARIFPELERDLRQRVDLGVGFKQDSGVILFRGENQTHPAIDGQAGTILRFYREHQMSSDDQFLKTNWFGIKKAVQFMLAQDKNGDGMIDTPMENTLDAVWEGEIAWIVGLCVAAARAAEEMANEVGDKAFAKVCSEYVTKGRKNMEEQLYNGEYFIHRPDSVQGRKKLGSYNTCHIDQVYGQSWAFQVGLPRVLDRDKTLSALKALWKYNFAMDVGPYIKTHVGGRPYALAGEGGMVMNTNPKNEPKPYGENVTWQLGYFHECMSGFEHQVAAHMMAEGMIDESLILTRVIHDRYHAAKRNPFNEIECSDHYARAMASYGTFISACGYEYHGPKGHIGFAPKVKPEDFRAAFTAAEGWGTYSQQKNNGQQRHTISLAYGELTLSSLSFELLNAGEERQVIVHHNGKKIALKAEQLNNKMLIRLKTTLVLKPTESLKVEII